MKNTILIIILFSLFSCNENEDMRKHEDCYKLDNLDEYLKLLPKGNTTVWAFRLDTEEWEEFACGYDEAYIRMYEYNCANYPVSEFSDEYRFFKVNGTTCE